MAARRRESRTPNNYRPILSPKYDPLWPTGNRQNLCYCPPLRGDLPRRSSRIRRRNPKLYDDLIEEEQISFITFHQSYGYEEFVEGLRPETGDNGTAGFRLVAKDGVLKQIAKRAKKYKKYPHVLVIDEINGPTSRRFWRTGYTTGKRQTPRCRKRGCRGVAPFRRLLHSSLQSLYPRHDEHG